MMLNPGCSNPEIPLQMKRFLCRTRWQFPRCRLYDGQHAAQRLANMHSTSASTQPRPSDHLCASSDSGTFVHHWLHRVKLALTSYPVLILMKRSYTQSRRGTGRNPRSEDGLVHLLGDRKSPEVAPIVDHDVDLGVEDLLVPGLRKNCPQQWFSNQRILFTTCSSRFSPIQQDKLPSLECFALLEVTRFTPDQLATIHPQKRQGTGQSQRLEFWQIWQKGW